MAELTEDIAMELHNMTITIQSAEAHTELRSKFPLPRELRDRIYAYLLVGEYVRDEPYHTLPPSQRHAVSMHLKPNHPETAELMALSRLPKRLSARSVSLLPTASTQMYSP